MAMVKGVGRESRWVGGWLYNRKSQ